MCLWKSQIVEFRNSQYAKYPHIYFGDKTRDFDFRSIGGEYAEDVRKRGLEICNEIGEKFGTIEVPHPLILIVSHGTILWLVLNRDNPTHDLRIHDRGKFQIITFP